MAELIAFGGNWLTAASWGVVEAGDSSNQNSAAGSTNNTTAYVYSPAFTVTNGAVIDGVLLQIQQLGTTGTFSVALSSDSGTTASRETTINASDLPSGTDDTFVFFKFPSTITGNGSATWKVGIKGSTANMVLVRRSATAADWFRKLRTSTTAAPAAADLTWIAGEWTAAATRSTVTVTMNQTATTAYGQLVVSDGGALTYDTTINSVLRLGGNLNVRPRGTFSMGTVATPIPITKTAVLEFVLTSSGQFGVTVYSGGTYNTVGSPRTSGKNIVRCKMNADAAAAATVLTVDTDTGWLSGDSIAIASTSKSNAQNEVRTLSVNATSTQLTITAGLTNAHGGVAPIAAEIILLTQNVTVRSTNSSFMTYHQILAGCTINMLWTVIQYAGVTSSTTAAAIALTTGAITGTFQYLTVRDANGCGFYSSAAASDGWHLEDANFYNCGNAGGSLSFTVAVGGTTGTSWSLQRIVVIAGGSSSVWTITLSDVGGTINDLTVAGSGGYGIFFNDSNATIDGVVVHANAFSGFSFGSGTHGLTLKNVNVWRNTSSGGSSAGVDVSGATSLWDIEINGGTWFGNNNTADLYAFANAPTLANFRFRNVNFRNDASFSLGYPITLNPNSPQFMWIIDWLFENCTFGVASSPFIAATTGGIQFGAGNMWFKGVFVNCKFPTTEISSASTVPASWLAGSSMRSAQHNQSVDHRTWTPQGQLRYETTTVDTGPSLKMTPLSTTLKLESGAGIPGAGFLVRIDSGQTITFTVKVQKDASYNGNAPRLLAKQHTGLLGNTADTVLDTLTAAAGTWQTLSGAITAVADGVAELVVDCDGTAGNVYVDTVSWS